MTRVCGFGLSRAGLCRACSPSKRPGLSIHPQQRKTAGKTARPGDGSQLRPWPPSAPRLARCACECVRARWAVAVFAFDIFPYIAAEKDPKICLFSRVCACAATSPPLYIYIYIYIYILKGGCVLCPRIMRASVCVFRASPQRRAAALCPRYVRAMPLCAPVACSVHIHSTSAAAIHRAQIAPRVRSLRVSCAFRAFCEAFALRVCNCATIYKKSPQTG